MRTAFWSTILAMALVVASFGAVAAQDDGTVTVVHGVPDLTVDVYVNGELTLESFAPGTITDPLTLPAGDYEIEIRGAGEPADADPAISGSATLPAGANASIVAHLDADGSPTLSVFVNDVSEIAAGNARLTVRHTAAAPAVDVLAGDTALFSNLANPNEATAAVPANTYSVAVVPAGTTDPVLGPVDLTLEAGTAYFVYAIGSLEDDSLDLLVQTISGLGAAPKEVAAGGGGLAERGGLSLVAAALAALAVAGLGASSLRLARRRR